MSAFLEPAPRPKLTSQAFPHLSAETELLTAYLSNAKHCKVKGINILIYGVPGTGKTEYVRWLAAKLGKSLFEVRACDEEGHPISGIDRMGFFLVSQRFLRESNALLLFDEIEDVFPTSDNGL